MKAYADRPFGNSRLVVVSGGPALVGGVLVAALPLTTLDQSCEVGVDEPAQATRVLKYAIELRH